MTRRESTGTRFGPFDMWCPQCHVAPGIRCVDAGGDGPPRSRPCHPARRLAAADATRRAAPPPPAG